jgi:hypothetical protein
MSGFASKQNLGGKKQNVVRNSGSSYICAEKYMKETFNLLLLNHYFLRYQLETTI